LATIPFELLKEAKTMGFSDEQLCRIMNDGKEDDVYEKRKAAGISRVFKMVDTCSAEFEAKTPYFYSTFETPSNFPGANGSGSTNESKVTEKKKIIVLGSGPNRIGQGIEFDYCCVHGFWRLKNAGMSPSW
jgi:carbamoyl-phosphate synthase large subunit